MKSLHKITLAAILLLVVFWSGKWVLDHWFDSPRRIDVCIDSRGLERTAVQEVDAFNACIERQAKLFLEKDYAETKDMGKTFLTLLSAILVASITFSEKIVDVSKAPLVPLSSMVVCWGMLLAAIVFCGVGLAFMTTAAGIAAYEPELNYRELEWRGVQCFLAAGIAFVLALGLLIIAGVASLIGKRAATASGGRL